MVEHLVHCFLSVQVIILSAVDLSRQHPAAVVYFIFPVSCQFHWLSDVINMKPLCVIAGWHYLMLTIFHLRLVDSFSAMWMSWFFCCCLQLIHNKYRALAYYGISLGYSSKSSRLHKTIMCLFNAKPANRRW